MAVTTGQISYPVMQVCTIKQTYAKENIWHLERDGPKTIQQECHDVLWYQQHL